MKFSGSTPHTPDSIAGQGADWLRSGWTTGKPKMSLISQGIRFRHGHKDLNIMKGMTRIPHDQRGPMLPHTPH